jgi:hypothetical protein
MKIPMLLRLAWAAQRSEGREVFQIARRARTQSERRVGSRWQPVFGSSDCLE